MVDPSGTVAPPVHPSIHDCWNKIGVHGNGTCPELSKYAHCRNCPVYIAVAMELLNGEMPDGYPAEWTRYFSRPKPAVDQAAHSVLIFRLGLETFALDVKTFREVSELKPIHSLPHRRDKLVLGLVNIRGELLICVSLTEILCLEKSPASKELKTGRPYLLVINHPRGRLVFPVDEVHGIHHLAAKEIKGVPSTGAGLPATYTKAKGVFSWQDQTVGYLNEETLMKALGEGLS